MFIKIMMDSLKTNPGLYRDECPAWLLTQHFGLSPTQTPSSSLRWKLAKPVWEMDPTKAYQSNVLQAIKRGKHTSKKHHRTLFSNVNFWCEVIRVKWGSDKWIRIKKIRKSMREREMVCKRAPLPVWTVSLG